MYTRFMQKLIIAISLGLMLLPLLNWLAHRPVEAQAAAEFQLTDYSTNPLHITNVTILPEPTVNQTATLHIEILSTEDQPEVWFTVNFLEMYGSKAHKVTGDVEWHGSLLAFQSHSFDIDVVVSAAGSWPIEIRVDRTANGAKYYAFETIHIESSSEAGRIVRAVEYNNTPPTTRQPLALSAQESVLQSACKSQPPLPPTVGQIQIIGNITYEARVIHVGEPTITTHSTLGRATMRLWDKSNLLIPLDITCTDANGYFMNLHLLPTHPRGSL